MDRESEKRELRCTAIVLAAGKGTRMGGDVRKQYLQIGGAPVFTWAYRALEESECITEMVLVVPEADAQECRQMLEEQGLGRKLRVVCAGGSERYFSVQNGLHAIDWPCDAVFIQDGARPFLDQKTIGRLFSCVQKAHACVAGVPSKDTVKIVDERGFVRETPDRSRVWIVQTPQVFSYELIRQAYDQAIAQIDVLAAQGVRITDDAMVVEQMTGTAVQLVMASYENIKITTPDDLVLAQSFVRERLGESAQRS